MKSPSPNALAFILPTLAIIAVCARVGLVQNKVQLPNNTEFKKDTTIKTPALHLTGTHEKGEKEPSLAKLAINVMVIGNIATTTVDMTFLNENDRIMEGELVFPLGEGQTVSRFALEVDNKLREAVVVDKNKGQQVYEELIRQNVDPGLLEQVQGNSYKARIYPLPANGTKRMVLAYEEVLPGDGKVSRYYLPLDYREAIKDFALHIEVAQQKVIKNSDGLVVEYRMEGTKTVADIKRNDFKEAAFLAFGIEQPSKTNVYLETTEGKTYFYASVQLDAESRPRKSPASIALFWDASGSASENNRKAELDLLKAYLSKLSSAKLTVIPFAHKIIDEKEFTTTPAGISALEAYLEQLPYDGATRLDALDFNKYNADEILLVSDGLSTFGEPVTQSSRSPITCISAGKQSDFDLLKYLAQSTGGNFINLNTVKPEDALVQLNNEPLRMISVEFKGEQASEVYPVQGSLIHDDFSVSGIAPPGNSKMIINYGYGNDKTGETKMVLDASKTEKFDGLLKRIWTQKKLQQLMLQKEKQKEKIIACAVENKIVTPFTSLLVLDRVEDYVKYKITPPDEFKAQYDSSVASAQKVEERTKQEQIDRVVSLFKERKDWWGKDYTSNWKADSLKKKNRTTTVLDINQNTTNNTIDYSITDTTFNNGEEVLRADSATVLRSWDFGNGSDSEILARRELGNAGVTRSYSVSVNSSAAMQYSSDVNESDQSVAYEWSNSLGFVDEQVAYASNASSAKVSTTLAAWEPNAPYVTQLKKAAPEKTYSEYLQLKKTNGNSPSFYLDVADLLIKQNKKEEALRVVSNLAEIELKNYRLLRVLAHKLEQMEQLADAISLYKQVLELRKEEPQSYRDLGLALARNGNSQEAIETMYQVIEHNWSGRFNEIELLVMGEINTIIAASPGKLNTSFIDARLITPMSFDARVILNWDADNCDIDLWVTDPRGEKCYYGNRNTKIGGRNSPDFTQGYGPEEFIIRKAMKGKYTVQINYYGTREQTVLGPTTVQLEMYTNYGKPAVKRQEVTRRLEKKKEVLEIGTFEIE